MFWGDDISIGNPQASRAFTDVRVKASGVVVHGGYWEGICMAKTIQEQKLPSHVLCRKALDDS